MSQQLFAFDLVKATPDAMGFTDAQGVIQAGSSDGAGGADGFGPGFASFLLILALEVRWRKEDRGLRPSTGRLYLPEFLDSLNAHCTSPFLGRNYSVSTTATRGEFFAEKALTSPYASTNHVERRCGRVSTLRVNLAGAASLRLDLE